MFAMGLVLALASKGIIQWGVVPVRVVGTGNMIYQAYERGFMVMIYDEADAPGSVRRSGSFLETNCIYAILSENYKPISYSAPYHYCVRVDELYPRLMPPAWSATYLMTTALHDLWSFGAMRAALGESVGTPMLYDAGIPPMRPPPTPLSQPSYLPVLTLPDGSALHCGARGGNSGSCTP